MTAVTERGAEPIWAKPVTMVRLRLAGILLLALLAPGWANPEHTLSRLKELIDGHTSRFEERDILSLLRGCDPQTLNFVLAELELGRLISSLDDHATGRPNRTLLLRLLSQDRVHELSVQTRANLVEALQRRRTSRAKEEAIVAILLASKGETLRQLKLAIDRGRDEYDLQHLIEHDLDDPSHAQVLFEHFQAQAPRVRRRKLLSDVDDTLYANWTDQRYPAKTVYPGVLNFYRAMAGPEGPTFLTARPDERSGQVKSSTHTTLANRGVKRAVVLAGSLRSLGSNQAMANRKFANFELYAKLFPEYDFCFVGDTGQGDGLLGEQMLARYPERIKGVFLHDVVGLGEKAKRRYQKLGIQVFQVYPEAARQAEELGLVTREQRVHLEAQAWEELKAIDFEDKAAEARLVELFEGLL